MGKVVRFALELLRARLRLFFYELSPAAYRRFRLAAALPRWRSFPFYRGVASFSGFPEMNKARMLASFAELNRFGLTYEACLEAGLAQERSREFVAEGRLPCSIGLSSGTSGRRGVFLTSEAERLRWAASVFAVAPFLPPLRRHRVAFFLRSSSPLYEEGGGLFLKFRYFDLTRDFGELYEEAVRYQATHLVAPPAVLAMVLEREAKERRLFPKIVVSVADRLPEDLKTRLRSCFGVPLHEVYQATEGFLGITCREGTLHLNEHLFLLEKKLHADGSFEPLVSDYFRASQAFVRFHLDDVLVPASAPCPCGSKRLALKEVRGRADDVLLLPAEAGGEVALLPDFVRQAIQNALARDLDFLLVQKSPGALELRLSEKPGDAELELIQKGLVAAIRGQGGQAPRIEWNFTLARPLGAKRRRVLRAPVNELAGEGRNAGGPGGKHE